MAASYNRGLNLEFSKYEGNLLCENSSTTPHTLMPPCDAEIIHHYPEISQHTITENKHSTLRTADFPISPLNID